ncbi:hypothetical protein K0M31_007287 [Melipona bicolor]|uniref:Uncharacterized protein n=1 Tax=Melipona bicolor TaxID=60889 RepID=A0AA40KVK6_9HYME|nr:hypothetical protein K0M31_007287 [Melipona bicolor]
MRFNPNCLKQFPREGNPPKTFAHKELKHLGVHYLRRTVVVSLSRSGDEENDLAGFVCDKESWECNGMLVRFLNGNSSAPSIFRLNAVP